MEYIILLAILAICAAFIVPQLRERARMRKARIVNTLHLGPSQGRLYEVPETLNNPDRAGVVVATKAPAFPTATTPSYVPPTDVDLGYDHIEPVDPEDEIEYDFLIVEDEDFEDAPSYDK